MKEHEYVTQTEFKIEFQKYSEEPTYVYQYRVELKELKVGTQELIGLNQALPNEKDFYENRTKLVTDLFQEYIDGTGSFVQKSEEALFRDHGDYKLKYHGVQEAIAKVEKEMKEDVNDIGKEYDQLCIDWVKMFDLPLEQNDFTVKGYIRYLDNMQEIDLLNWAKRMVKDYHECLINDEFCNYGKLSKEEQIESTRSFIRDWLYSNEGWANGFFEADIFQEEFDPDETILEVIGDMINKLTTRKVDRIMKEHEDEIIEEIFGKGK